MRVTLVSGVREELEALAAVPFFCVGCGPWERAIQPTRISKLLHEFDGQIVVPESALQPSTVTAELAVA